MEDIAVRFQNVWKSYPSYNKITGGIKSFLFNFPQAIRELRDRRTVLENVSFEIKRGETFGFIGRNGAGKSTTLGLIAGVLAPEKGKVQVFGRVSPLLALGAGFHPELTGRENIMLNGVLLGLTKREIREMEEEIIEFSGLGHFINQPVRIYSTGMYAKLGFSVIAFLKPDILIVDEILSVGDMAFNAKCEKKFEEFRKNGNITIIMVSHSLGSVEKLCDRVAWVENRQIRAVGKPSEIVAQYKKAHAPVVPKASVAPVKKPPQLSVTALPEKDARHFSVKTNNSAPAPRLRVTLLKSENLAFLGQVDIDTPNFTIDGRDNTHLVLTANDRTVPLDQSGGAFNADEPYIIGLQGIFSDNSGTPPFWTNLCLSANAEKIERRRQQTLLASSVGQTLPPHLWPGGNVVRLVARNITTHDAVGNFVIGMAATLRKLGIPAKTYAYVFSPEYAGLISPVSDLPSEMKGDDLLYYHFSTEDEFLPEILKIPAKKRVLYYHNVTPGHWFKECRPNVAAVLDRAMKQHALFSSFDAVAANSRFSLENVLPHIKPETPTAIFPPTMFPQKLAKIAPEPLDLPADWQIMLWVGRIVPHKQPGLAVEIFEKVANLSPKAALVMVGGGKEDYEALFRALNEKIENLLPAARERVVLLENLTDGQLAWLYRRSSLLLCTSGHEGYCLPVAEACQFNLPVAALPQPAVLETLNGKGTILPENAAEAATVISGIMQKRNHAPSCASS